MKHVLNATNVKEKLVELNGNMAAVARALGVTRQAVHAYISKRPKLMAVAIDMREAMKDHVVTRFYEDCLKDDPAYQASRIFFLKTQGRDRGFGEKLIIENTNLVITEVIVSAREDATQLLRMVETEAQAIEDRNASTTAAEPAEIIPALPEAS